MKKVKAGIILFVILLMIPNIFAAQINSTTYKQNVVVSAGSENMSSSSYKTNLAIGLISRIINSSSFINSLGFFYTWKLANDQPCTNANQCEGSFCCSSLCKSTSCPTEDTGGGTSGGGSGSSGGAGAGGGGGGGGGAAPVAEEVKEFSVGPGSIKEHIALGIAKTKTITIRNTGNAALDFSMNVIGVNDFVFLSDTSFSLGAGEEKNVEANIIGKRLGSYIGEIDVTANGIKKSIGIVIEIESEQVLFDAKIDIPSGYKEIQAGKELKAQITLLNVGPPRKVDVTTTYIIKDRQGNIVYESSETFAVEKQTSFAKSFKIPENLQPGEYLAIIELRYENSFAVSSELFRVLPKEAAIERAVKSKAALIALLVSAGAILLFALLKAGIFKKRSKRR